LDIKFNASMEQRTASIKAYNDALREQVRALEASGARAVAGVGRGDRQAGVAQQLDDNDRNYAREKRRLAEREKEMDPVEYAENLRNLGIAHTDMTNQILKNDKDIQDANADWTNGFTKAVENAQDIGMDFAGTMNSALTGAFESAGDALATFVTTGKINFKDFARSVMADMASMAARQAAMGALGAVFNIAGSALGAYFGSSTSLGSTQAGYSSQYMDSYVPGRMAKGAVVNRFAKGDVLSNSIVTSPTRFAMGGVNPGIGEVGEGGRPEAIMPLQRTANGDLGVKVSGSGGGVVNVNVVVNSDGSTSTSTDGGANWTGFGEKIGPMIRNEVYQVLNNEMRPGGTIEPQKGR
jgi:lambda family phage tail tape measure protein